MGVLDGVHIPQGEGEVLGIFSSTGLNGIFVYWSQTHTHACNNLTALLDFSGLPG